MHVMAQPYRPLVGCGKGLVDLKLELHNVPLEDTDVADAMMKERPYAGFRPAPPKKFHFVQPIAGRAARTKSEVANAALAAQVQGLQPVRRDVGAITEMTPAAALPVIQPPILAPCQLPLEAIVSEIPHNVLISQGVVGVVIHRPSGEHPITQPLTKHQLLQPIDGGVAAAQASPRLQRLQHQSARGQGANVDSGDDHTPPRPSRLELQRQWRAQKRLLGMHPSRDADESPEVRGSKEMEQRVLRINFESRQIEREHLEVRRRRKQEHRSHDHHEKLHEKQASAWSEVCDSTQVMDQDRKSIERLYRTPIRALLAAKSKSKCSSRQDDGYGGGCEEEDCVEMAAGDEIAVAHQASVFDTKSSLLLQPDLPNVEDQHRPYIKQLPPLRTKQGAPSPSPPPAAYPSHDPRQHYTPKIAKAVVPIHRVTQDVIAAMERRYHLEIEAESRRAIQAHVKEGRIRKVDEERLLAARHAIYEQASTERRREEAKRRAQELEDQRRDDARAKLLEDEARSAHQQMRNGAARRSANLRPSPSLGRIVRHNELMMALA